MKPYSGLRGFPGLNRSNVHAYGVPDLWFSRTKRREINHRFSRRLKARARRQAREFIASETENYYESLELAAAEAIEEFYEHYCA